MTVRMVKCTFNAEKKAHEDGEYSGQDRHSCVGSVSYEKREEEIQVSISSSTTSIAFIVLAE